MKRLRSEERGAGRGVGKTCEEVGSGSRRE